MLVYSCSKPFSTLSIGVNMSAVNENQKTYGKYKFKCFASIFHIIGSVAYLLGAIFGGHIPQDQQNLLATPQLFVCNIIGMVALIIEAILTLIGWMCRLPDEKSCHCPHGVILWAHLLNILGGLIYLAVSILPPIMTAIYSATMTQTTIYQNYVKPVQIVGDGIYLIDALLYMVLWFKERKQQNEIKDKEPVGPQGRRIKFLR